MIGYTTIGTNDLEKATAFYDALFADLGVKKITPNERLVLWSSKAGAAMIGVIKPFDGQAATVGNGTMVALMVDDGETVFLWNGDNDRPVRIELHKQQEGQTLGVDHLSFLVDDPIDAQKEIEFIGGVDFLFEPFENQQSGRTISNSYDPDGLQIQMARQTSPGTFKNWE